MTIENQAQQKQAILAKIDENKRRIDALLAHPDVDKVMTKKHQNSLKKGQVELERLLNGPIQDETWIRQCGSMAEVWASSIELTETSFDYYLKRGKKM